MRQAGGVLPPWVQDSLRAQQRRDRDQARRRFVRTDKYGSSKLCANGFCADLNVRPICVTLALILISNLTSAPLASGSQADCATGWSSAARVRRYSTKTCSRRRT